MSEADRSRKSCPRCGEAFICDYELGKECWCAKKFPAVMPVKNLECYCEKCLELELKKMQGQR